MRKLLAIALLALFGFSFVSPLLASTVNGDAKLPACCRKSAKHHCMAMQDDSAASAADGTHVHAEFRPHMEHCPCCGVLGTTATHVGVISFTPMVSNVTPRCTRSGLSHQTSILLTAEVSRSHGKRGPPSSFPA